MQRLSGLAAILAVFFVPVAQAAEKKVQIYDGISVQQIIDFANRQGWSAKKSALKNAVEMEVASRRFILLLSNCSTRNVCVNGRLESRRFSQDRRRRFSFAKANNGLGATIYHDGFFIARRLLTFRGVTDVYLRETIRWTWVPALEVFDRTVRAHDTR